MSADILAELRALSIDIHARGCDAARIGELQQIVNLAGQVLREAALVAQRDEQWAREGLMSPAEWAAAHTGRPQSGAL